MSNTKIAQALFISRKTVEKRLSDAYRKLQINNRNQLAEALRASIPPGIRQHGPESTILSP